MEAITPHAVPAGAMLKFFTDLPIGNVMGVSSFQRSS